MSEETERRIFEFNRSNPDLFVSYGGDGTLLSNIRENKFSKKFIPIRNYGVCSLHTDVLGNVLSADLNKKNNYVDNLTETTHKLLSVSFSGVGHGKIRTQYSGFKAIAEIVVKSKDPTSALRFDVEINGKPYLSNCMSDAFIFSSEMGSHGYWKSVTRTIFRGEDNFGFGFVAPTYGINNLVLTRKDKVCVRMKRETSITVSLDKKILEHDVGEDDLFYFTQSDEFVSFLGYDIFCCYNCRKNRNSTTLNDMYFV